jgi:Domain of unknown function (DUF6265)
MTQSLPMALLLTLCTLVAPSRAAAGVEQLSWLSGCWAAVSGEPGSGEQWMAPAGGTMLGASRTVRGGVTRQHEFMQLRDAGDGLVFIAKPSGQAEASFPAEQVGARSVTFHNAAHDYPQRVIYESPDDSTLDARIEGLRNGQLRAIRFPMKRVACPLGAAR